jgi:hypothetical protein
MAFAPNPLVSDDMKPESKKVFISAGVMTVLAGVTAIVFNGEPVIGVVLVVIGSALFLQAYILDRK